MKLNKKIVIISIIVILLIVFIALLVINKKITKPSYYHTAIIYHTETLGVDTGTSYKYYLYQENQNTYIYVKTISDITIAGESEEKDISKGKIKSKKDLKKIEQDIEKDKNKGNSQYISFEYQNEKIESFEDLSNKLFED